MSEIQVASRYAKSLIDLAEERDSLEKIKSDIEGFVRVVKENSQLYAVLRNPIIGPDKKIAILDQIFGSDIDPMIMGFFKIVVSKGRAEVLYATGKELLNEYNRRKKIFKATVTSAVPLSTENIKQIEQVVREATKGEVVLETRTDPDIIGGFILKVGDKQFDTSISGSLNKLKKEFAQRIY